MNKIIILLTVAMLSGCSSVMYDDTLKNAFKYSAQQAVADHIPNPRFGDITIHKDPQDEIRACGTASGFLFIAHGHDVLLQGQPGFKKEWEIVCKQPSP